MAKVNVHEAKTHLSRLIGAALVGEEVVICRDGHPVVRLVPYRDLTRPIEGGFAEGKLVVHGEVTDPMPDSWLDETEKEGGI
jgi:prevent-host-death family protein